MLNAGVLITLGAEKQTLKEWKNRATPTGFTGSGRKVPNLVRIKSCHTTLVKHFNCMLKDIHSCTFEVNIIVT